MTDNPETANNLSINIPLISEEYCSNCKHTSRPETTSNGLVYPAKPLIEKVARAICDAEGLTRMVCLKA
jgi:hypothetical protein